MNDTRPEHRHLNGKTPTGATDLASTTAALEVQVSMLWRELEEVRSAHLAFAAKVEPHLGNLQALDRFIVAIRGLLMDALKAVALALLAAIAARYGLHLKS